MYLTPKNFTATNILELHTLSSPHSISKGSKTSALLPPLFSIGQVLQKSRAKELCVKLCNAKMIIGSIKF